MNAEQIAKLWSDKDPKYDATGYCSLARALLVAIGALEQIYGHGESFEQAQMAKDALAKIRGAGRDE